MAAGDIIISDSTNDAEQSDNSAELDVLTLVATNSDNLPPELAWQERALCAQTDPEAFFPEKGGSTREAKRVCMSCEVRAECLEYALAKDERFGIWGGLSERERRRVKKQAV
ncbi:WhiB family transcriptional regulator [Kineosporia succinea]